VKGMSPSINIPLTRDVPDSYLVVANESVRHS
jgi:hypothetical protein